MNLRRLAAPVHSRVDNRSAPPYVWRVDLGFDIDRIARMSLALETNSYDRDRAATFLVSAPARRIDGPAY